MPELYVIPDGVLNGFVIINPRWASFKAEDYRKASEEIIPDTELLLHTVFPFFVGRLSSVN